MRITLVVYLIVFISSVQAQINENLKVTSYQLENGLTVFLNVDRKVKKVFGAVAVNAGSKNDPADATGIAHYLEHLLFKGTTELGTWDYEAEKPKLDSINNWYERLSETTDESLRSSIQQKINELSIAASKYSLPNEFDNLLKSIGSTGVNAFTSPDMTFYHNSFPPNQIEKWLEIYSHRFQKPVFRSFQSELEVVYEEKNRAMDGFEYQIFETFMNKLFAPHPYGTQTTLGKTEHLKNPSLHKMYEFFKTYYVANNMALILTGDFNSEDIKPWIEKTFGQLKSGEVKDFPDYPIKQFEGKEKVNVRFTPVKAAVIGYKTQGAAHEDQPVLDVMSTLLSNSSETGFLDKLVQDNKIMVAEMIAESLNDDGAHLVVLVPKILRQSFGKAEKLVLNQFEKLKNGDFDEKMLNAVKNEIYINFQTDLEDLRDRGTAIGYAFNQKMKWEDYLDYPNKVNSVSKEDIILAARKYYGEDVLALYSKMGFPKKEKLEKPAYRPVKPDASKSSDYAKDFIAKKGIEKIPEFIDFEKDVTFIDLRSNNRLYVTPNPINDVFTMTIKYQYGNDNNRDLKLATDIMNYAGTKDRSMSQLKSQFAEWGLKYNIYSSRNYMNVILEGKEENLEKGLQLLNELVHRPVIDDKAMKLIHKTERTNRRIEKRTPTVYGTALRYYAIYGQRSPSLRRHTLAEIKAADKFKLIDKFLDGMSYAATIHYVGNTDPEAFKSLFLENYNLDQSGKREPLIFLKPARYKKGHVYVIHDKKAVQSQVYFYMAGEDFKKKDYAKYQAFNSYFGDGFSGLVLQEIREYRSLAYSAWGRYFHQLRMGERSFLNSHVGCQADKTNEAIDVMMRLLKNLPEKPERMPLIKSSLQQKIFTEYPSFRRVSSRIEGLKKVGYRKDPNELAYPDFESLEFGDIMELYETHLKEKPVVITIYGNKNKMNLDELARFGEVEILSKKDVIVF